MLDLIDAMDLKPCCRGDYVTPYVLLTAADLETVMSQCMCSYSS